MKDNAQPYKMRPKRKMIIMKHVIQCGLNFSKIPFEHIKFEIRRLYTILYTCCENKRKLIVKLLKLE